MKLKVIHGKDQAKWFKLIFERRLGEIVVDRDMTKEMLRRRKNFDHPTVECIHVHDGLSLLRRASEYKCEIVNRMTAVYASKLQNHKQNLCINSCHPVHNFTFVFTGTSQKRKTIMNMYTFDCRVIEIFPPSKHFFV